MQQQYQSCIDACNACADACDMCSTACLQEDDVKMMARCIALDMDCAQICRLAAAFMARGSEFAGALCQLCAQICHPQCRVMVVDDKDEIVLLERRSRAATRAVRGRRARDRHERQTRECTRGQGAATRYRRSHRGPSEDELSGVKAGCEALSTAPRFSGRSRLNIVSASPRCTTVSSCLDRSNINDRMPERLPSAMRIKFSSDGQSILGMEKVLSK